MLRLLISKIITFGFVQQKSIILYDILYQSNLLWINYLLEKHLLHILKMSSVQEKGSCPDKKMAGMSVAYPDLSKFFMVMYMIQIHERI